jgi:hypothetical protein
MRSGKRISFELPNRTAKASVRKPTRARNLDKAPVGRLIHTLFPPGSVREGAPWVTFLALLMLVVFAPLLAANAAECSISSFKARYYQYRAQHSENISNVRKYDRSAAPNWQARVLLASNELWVLELPELECLAKKGDQLAQYLIGGYRIYTDGADKDMAAGMQWLSLAAKPRNGSNKSTHRCRQIEPPSLYECPGGLPEAHRDLALLLRCIYKKPFKGTVQRHVNKSLDAMTDGSAAAFSIVISDDCLGTTSFIRYNLDFVVVRGE